MSTPISQLTLELDPEEEQRFLDVLMATAKSGVRSAKDGKSAAVAAKYLGQFESRQAELAAARRRPSRKD